MTKKWQMPSWLQPYIPYVSNCSGEPIEKLMSCDPPPASLRVWRRSVARQLELLARLHKAGLLKEPPEPFRNRATHPSHGDQTCCRLCGQDIEYHGEEYGWIDRGGNRLCPSSVRAGEVITPPADQKHAPISDV